VCPGAKGRVGCIVLTRLVEEEQGTYRIVPELDSQETHTIENNADDKVYTECQASVLNHGISDQWTKDTPWKSDEIESSLSVSTMFIRDEFTDSCKTIHCQRPIQP
jgi:hypothetical protein